MGAKKISLSAVLAALSLAFLMAAGIVPGIELTMYAAASLMPAFMIIEFKGKGGWGLYTIVALLGLLILPNKLAIIPYAMFFGLYGIIKYYIEKLKHPAAQLVTKGIVFLGIFSVAFFLMKEAFFAGIVLPDLATPILFIGGLLFFYLYDAIYTGFINLYLRKIHPHVK